MNVPTEEVSFSSEMMRALRKGMKNLPNVEKLKAYLMASRDDEGAFSDREGQQSLYYTAFGIALLEASGSDFDRRSMADTLRSFGKGEGLDLLSLSGLCRSWSWLSNDVPELGLAKGISKNLELYRCPDLGYSQVYSSRQSTVYACFKAFGAYQDLELTLPDEIKYIKSLNSYMEDGFFSNEKSSRVSALATAHGTALLRALEEDVPHECLEALKSFSVESGGFKAFDEMPVADVLSTASVLWQLKSLKNEVQDCELHKRFILSLQDKASGAFFGHSHDTDLDTEFTFHAIMALGFLES